MLKMLTAYTLEMDDPEYALEEIEQQLQCEKNLLAHSAGVLICHPDFIDAGVAQHIAKSLPFEVIGGTSLSNLTTGGDEPLMLSLSVYTSDEISFSTLSVPDLSVPGAMESAYRSVARPGEQPALLFTFFPLLMTMGAEQMVLDLDKVAGGAPIFGTVVIDHTPTYSKCFTLLGGEVSQGALRSLLFWGDLQPAFCVSQMSGKYIQKQRAIITKSQGSVLMEVNDVPLTEYLETIGVTRGKATEALGAVPFLVDFGDGTQPVARGIHTVTPEGYALCGGLMPENATLAIGSVEFEDVLRMTRETIQAALDKGKRQGFLMFPCASHFLVLGADITPQRDILKALTPDSLPYQLCYSGGEVCPVYDKDGKLHNRFHSYSFIACIF